MKLKLDGSHFNGIILYDFLLTKGGAESVALNLHRRFPDSVICVDFVNPGFQDEIIHSDRIVTLGTVTNVRGWQSIKGMWNFWRHARADNKFEWAIYSGSNAPVAVFNILGKYNILYCHTIPRFAYDLEEFWYSRLTGINKILFKVLVKIVRTVFSASAARMDIIISNSNNVKARVKKYLDLDSKVIYPPCNINSFKWLTQGDYYLSTARLEPYKRVEEIIKAFKRMPDKKLVVCSGGSEETKLKTLAASAPNIKLLGWVSKEKLSSLVGNAIATIYIPIDEDFGLSPVESMAAGKPVIGVAEGGLLETVIHEQTGFLLSPEFSEAELMEAVMKMDKDFAASLKGNCEKRAMEFSEEKFYEEIKSLISGKENVKD